MSPFQAHILSNILLTPMLAAVVLFLVPASRVNAIRAIGVVAAAVTTVLAVWLFFAYDRQAAGFQFLSKVPWVPSLGIAYQVGVDGISVAMVLLTAIVFLAGALVSCSVQTRVKDFYILLAALVSGVFGVFVSLDLFFFYFFYELAVVPMYLLIGYWGSGDKEYATMKLTLYLTAGAIVALIGLLMLYFSGLTPTPTFDLLELKRAVETTGGLSLQRQQLLFPILLVGFATIAPMWPLHSWSPIGHAAAPAAASMMHAGVLMKLGSYAIIRIAMTLLPQGEEQSVGGFDVYVVVGNKDNDMSDVAQKSNQVRVPKAAMSQLSGKFYTYTLELLIERGLNKISLGVVDQISNTSGFTREQIIAQNN